MTHYESFLKIDIDRVQRCLNMIEKNNCSRGCGKTFTCLVQMLGEVQLGATNNIYVYIGENEAHARHTKNDFEKILNHENFNFVTSFGLQNKTRVIHQDNVQEFYFVPITNELSGLQLNRMFLDLSPNKRYDFKQTIQALQTRVNRNGR